MPSTTSEPPQLLSPEHYFDLSSGDVASLFVGLRHVWEVLDRIAPWIADRLGGRTSRIDGDVAPLAFISPAGVFIEAGAVVENGAHIVGPTYIAAGAQVRHGAYIRGGTILFPNAILGHAGESKNSILLPSAQAPHFAYLGDSVLGNDVNLGAGTKLSNLAITSRKDPTTQQRPPITVWCDGHRFETGRPKLGAIIGDRTSTGCNSVLSPGTLIGPGTLVYPNVSVARGVYPASTVLSSTEECLARRR